MEKVCVLEPEARPRASGSEREGQEAMVGRSLNFAVKVTGAPSAPSVEYDFAERSLPPWVGREMKPFPGGGTGGHQGPELIGGSVSGQQGQRGG